MAIKYRDEQTKRIVEAAASLRNSDPDTLVQTESIDSIVIASLRQQVEIDSKAGKIQDDVKALVGVMELQGCVVAAYNDKKKSVPSSVIEALEARAKVMPAEEG